MDCLIRTLVQLGFARSGNTYSPPRRVQDERQLDANGMFCSAVKCSCQTVTGKISNPAPHHKIFQQEISMKHQNDWQPVSISSLELHDHEARAEVRRQKNISANLAKQRDAMLQAIQQTKDSLRKAGASLPAPEASGTIDGSIITGLSIALAVLEANTDQFFK